MTYKCYDCGREFENLETWEESRGEFWGMPAYEEMCGCPYCHSGDYGDAEEGESDDETDDEEN